jgi:hypothetical protein
MMRGLVLSAVCLAVLAGCGKTSNREKLLFDGYAFKTSIKDVKEDPLMFDVTVKGANQSRTGAEDAGRYEATRYCVVNYGNSKLEWLVVQETAGRDLQVEKDTLLLRGRCEA